MPDGLAPFFSVTGQQTGVLAYLAVVAGNTLLNWVALPRLGLHPWPETSPKVAVLIPARNEERNIRRCVKSLLNQDYPDFGIWVLDDDSGDRTFAILAELAAHAPRLHVHKSAPLPPGWLGKNWACWQLAQAVPEGFPLLLFVDADTWHAPDMLRVTVAALLVGRYDLLSILPRQITGTWVERLTVPILPWALLSHFPLWLTGHLRWPALSAAVGQFMLWRRAAYQMIGGHAAVHTKVAEDIAMARRAAALGLCGRLLPGSEHVFCRMYCTTGEVLQGLGKNLYAIFGKRWLPYLFVWLWMSVVFLSPWIIWLGRGLAGWPGSSFLAGLSILAAFMIWAGVIRMAGLQRMLIFFYPLITFSALILAFHSMGQILRHRARWKGRPVS